MNQGTDRTPRDEVDSLQQIEPIDSTGTNSDSMMMMFSQDVSHDHSLQDPTWTWDFDQDGNPIIFNQPTSENFLGFLPVDTDGMISVNTGIAPGGSVHSLPAASDWNGDSLPAASDSQYSVPHENENLDGQGFDANVLLDPQTVLRRRNQKTRVLLQKVLARINAARPRSTSLTTTGGLHQKVFGYQSLQNLSELNDAYFDSLDLKGLNERLRKVNALSLDFHLFTTKAAYELEAFAEAELHRLFPEQQDQGARMVDLAGTVVDFK